MLRQSLFTLAGLWLPLGIVAEISSDFSLINDNLPVAGNREAISSIDAEQFNRIYQLYRQYQFDDNRRLQCGQLGANLEFAMAPLGGAFISPQLDKQLERIKHAGILSATEQQQLTDASDRLSQIRNRLTDSFAKWQQAQRQMQATVDQIVEIGEIVEER